MITAEQSLYYLAKFCLFPSNEGIALIIIIGLFSRYRIGFIHASYLLFFSIIFNCLLKAIFQIPLNSKLGIEGYAFPSGHMQVSTAFYMYFILSFHNTLLRFLLILVLAGVSFGLIYLGYHDYIDVFEGVLVGIISSIIYERWTQITEIEKIGGVLFCITTIILLSLYLFYIIKINAYFAYAGIIIFNLTILIMNNRKSLSI